LGTKRTKKNKNKKEESSSEEDSKEEENDDSSEESSEEETKKKAKDAKSPKKKEEAKPKAKVTKAKTDSDDSDDSDDSEDSSSSEDETLKSPTKKRKTANEEENKQKKPKIEPTTPTKSPVSLAPVSTPTQSEEGSQTRLFMSNLSFKIDDPAIKSFFSACGEVTEIKWITDKDTGNFFGKGFIEFDTAESAAAAIKLDGQSVLDRPIKLQYANTTKRAERPARPSASPGGAKFSKPSTEKPSGCNTVFIGNLAFSIDDDKVHEVFGSCGAISGIRWISDRESGDFKGCGFVEFEDTSATDKAVALNGTDVLGRAIRVDFAAARAPRQ